MAATTNTRLKLLTTFVTIFAISLAEDTAGTQILNNYNIHSALWSNCLFPPYWTYKKSDGNEFEPCKTNPDGQIQEVCNLTYAIADKVCPKENENLTSQIKKTFESNIGKSPTDKLCVKLTEELKKYSNFLLTTCEQTCEKFRTVCELNLAALQEIYNSDGDDTDGSHSEKKPNPDSNGRLRTTQGENSTSAAVTKPLQEKNDTHAAETKSPRVENSTHAAAIETSQVENSTEAAGNNSQGGKGASTATNKLQGGKDTSTATNKPQAEKGASTATNSPHGGKGASTATNSPHGGKDASTATNKPQAEKGASTATNSPHGGKGASTATNKPPPNVPSTEGDKPPLKENRDPSGGSKLPEAGESNNKQYKGIGGDSGGTSGNFMAYFLTAVVLCIAGYVVFHNKQKIIAFIIEGRTTRQRRRTNGAGEYKKLQSSVEEVMPSLDKSTSSRNFIY